MNQFAEQFGDRIKSFWEVSSEGQRQKLLADVLQFARSNPKVFKQDLEEVQFDKELTPLPVVLEALSKDTKNWGEFYVDTLDKIFKRAKQSDKPEEVLSNLMEFAYIEEDCNPFVQKIVDRLSKEIDSDNLSTRLASIRALPPYLINPSVRNRSLIIASLSQKLNDKNWKIRYVTFKSLEFDGLLPAGHKLTIADKIRKLMFGEP